MAAIFAVAAISCEHEPDSPVVPPDDSKIDPGSDPGETPGVTTYKFVATPLQGKWKEGDKIYVHGKMGSWSEVVTLSASDISADGRTATSELHDVTQDSFEPDGLYAAWPDEAVKHINSKIGTKTSFECCEGLLGVAYLSGDTFNFIDAASSLTFSVSGGYDRFALSANDRNGVIVTVFEVDHSSKGTSMKQKQNSGYPFLYGDITAGSPVKVWMPGSMSFKGGLTLHLGKDGQWPAAYIIEGDVVLEPGKTLDLGDISSSLIAYEGPEPKMPVMGESTKFTVGFNELSGLCLSEDEDFLWSVGDNGDLARLSFEGEVISQVHIGGDSEAVTRDPRTGDLLIGLEPDGIGIVKGPGFNERATTLFSIPAAKNFGNAGLEGLTYYKDGLVYAGTQSNSALFLCDLESKQVLWQKNLYNKELVSEIAGLCYDPLTDWLWIIDSEAKKLFVFTGDVSTFLGAYPIKGDNPESLCVDHKNSCVWVGDDYGSTSYLFRVDFTGLDDAIIK